MSEPIRNDILINILAFFIVFIQFLIFIIFVIRRSLTQCKQRMTVMILKNIKLN